MFDCELTDFVVEEMRNLADLRKETFGTEWHIDHIVPLNHPEACGLHLYTNLQLVPAQWNLKKGNRDMTEYAGY